jgi:hypothetical protein
MKMKAILFAAAAALSVSTAGSAATVNLDGFTNASIDGTHAVSLALGAGTYQLNFTTDAYTAFSRFSVSQGCDGAGSNCYTGFENSARYVINGSTFLFGDGAASGGLGPVSGGAYYDTAAHSFAASSQYSQRFTLTSATNVSFYLFDDALGDNRGGVSLSVSSVPEPASWGLLISGFALVGAAVRRRKTTVTTRFA